MKTMLVRLVILLSVMTAGAPSVYAGGGGGEAEPHRTSSSTTTSTI